MRFWTREAAGWLLVAAGLFVFYKCYVLLTDKMFVHGAALTAIGFILFRGGLHLLKVAVAAQVCLQAREDVKPKPADGRGRLAALFRRGTGNGAGPQKPSGAVPRR